MPDLSITTSTASATRKRGRSARRLPAELEMLIGRALGPTPEYQFHSVVRVAALAKALDDIGIPAQAVARDVSFDPTNRAPYCVIVALRISGCITDCDGNYGWKRLIDKERVDPDDQAAYTLRRKPRVWRWEDLHKLSSAAVQQVMEKDRRQISSVVQHWTLHRTTPSSLSTSRRARL